MSLTEEELLKCPFCHSIYDDPICLPCGHSLCQLCAVCLESLVEEQNETAAPCPVCRHSVSSSPLPISHYPRNIALRELCAYLTESSESAESTETSSEVLFCNGNHDEQVIERFCLICRNLICATCEGSALHRGHAVVSLSDGDNLLEVSCRVKQYCEEEITALFERLEANRANLNSVRKCMNSTEKGFRLLESNITSMQREVFFSREKLFQEGYKDEEIRCIEERQILKTKLATSDMFLSKLTVHANGRVKLSEIHHALLNLNAATPAKGVVGVSDHDSYSLKLGTELNEVLDQCAEVLTRMKSQFPAPEGEVAKQELASNSVGTSSKLIDSHYDRIEPTSRFEKGNVDVKLPTNGTQCETSVRHTSPILHGISQQISQKGNGVNERIGEDVDHESYMDINNVNLLSEVTGEKFYVGFDEPLDIQNYSPINENESYGSAKNPSLSTSETGNDSLPEVQFLTTSPSPCFDHSDVVLVRTFGSRGKENGQFNQPEALAVDVQSGNLYVADSCNNRIQVFSQNLEFRFTFGRQKRGRLRTPLGIAIHPDTKAVIVVDSYNNRLQFYSENGDFLEKVGQKGHGSCVGFFDVPNSVAVNSKGHVIVTDTRGHRVHLITSDGIEDGYIFGQKGDGDLQFKHPTGVAVDEDDRIFVADYGNNRIQVLSSTGEFLFSFGDKLLALPSNVAVSPRGNIFVSDVGNNNVKVFDCKGNFLTGFGSEGTKTQLFKGPSGISWLLDGQLVVGDVFCSNLRLFHCPY